MKKLFFRYTTGFIPLIAMFSCAYAQNSNSSSALTNAAPTELAFNNKAKVRDIPTSHGTTTVSISTKAIKDFTKTYKNADKVGWFIIKDGYLAEFKQDGIATKVFYDRKGRWVGNLRSYFEDKLPGNIRHLVKSHYYDFNIYYVQEVTVNDGIIVYLVKIEDKTSFKTIRVQDGEMDEMEAFKKSE
jgi:hypothetical protein